MVIIGILKWIGAILVFFWALGFFFKFGGIMIHLLLVIAAILFIYDFIFNRRNV